MGWLLSSGGLGGVAGAYLGGRLAHRFGPIPVLVASLSLSAPCYVLIPYCDSIASLWGALFACQLVSEATRPATATATTLLAPDRHSQAIALNRLALNLGCSIGPVVGGVLATIDFFWIFPTNAVFVLAAAAAASWFFRGQSLAPADLDDERVPPLYASPWRDRQFVVFLVYSTLSAFVFFQVITTLPLYWREQCGLSELAIGLLFAVNTVLIVFTEMPLTSWARRYRLLTLVACGSALYGVGFGLTPLVKGFASAALLTVVWTVGEMLAAPFSAAYAAERSGPAVRGLYMGAFATAMSVANVVAPLVGMSLYEWNPAAPWWGGMALAIGASLGMLSLGARAETPAAA